ncbi:MAG TPA: hypothetical protein PK625_03375 [Spirochaetales bacterium]|nr:hypothetical protein [Spirochaetia bacterium]HPE36163.1 hypothetical protein [Spirochaetales bacterium]
MKKTLTVLLFMALAVSAFAMGARQAMTEDEALAMIDAKVTELELTLEDSQAAKEAFAAMVEAQVRVENAFRVVSDAMDGGLKAKEMTALAEQVRQRSKAGGSAGECEEAAKLMVREQIRTRDQAQLKDGSGDGVTDLPGTGAGAGAGN